MSDLMTVKRVATILEVSRKRVYQLIIAGRLESLRLSPRTIRVTKASLEQYVQQKVKEQKAELGLDLPKPPKRRHE